VATVVRLTVAEFDRMIEQGVLDESRHERIELIQGELRQMCPPGPTHEEVTDRIAKWSMKSLPLDAVRLRTASSVGIPKLDSVPYPDLAWVNEKDYSVNRPTPNDVLLLVEVSDSSLRYDRGDKADIYAGAGIKDYWVVNIPDQCVEVFRDPRRGGYKELRTYDLGESVSPLAFPKLALPVSQLFTYSPGT
jgi:Uma2 family endonuclease